MQWGDVPTWVGAVAAAGAAWFAFQTIKSQREQIGEQQVFIAEQSRFMAEQQQNLELERVELRAAAEERRVSQARQVRMSFRTAGSGGRDSTGSLTGYDHWAVEVANTSDAPIRDVMVRFGDAYNADTAREKGAARAHPDRGVRPVPVALIPVGHVVVFTSPRMSEVAVDNNRPALLFTDSSGLRWRHDSWGALEEVPGGNAS
ncbi:hypothetical protein ACR9VJ_18180 [Streptomyces sp. H49]|uniref:hypothetical protein n=1 Tax=Streptomyces sp. H49 TaxID=3444117 RepID=UPI003F4AE6BE